ncbi:MAG: MBOAT family protein, partial [Clostridia bacterium]|nr:MBOAT family protein [Clostridia bacterium]
MVFSSLEFIYYYLPLCFFIYFIIPAKYLAVRNAALFFTSLAFYGWSEPIYILIMLFSTVVDYICGFLVGKFKELQPKKAKAALIASVSINLSVLFFFKYFDFVIKTLSLIPVFSGLEPLGLALPVGISFYTFQTMSYTIDIYMGNASVQKNILSFGSYVTMFPQLIAGPIVRYKDVDAYLRKREHSFNKAYKGAARFICGLAKKVLLANTSGAMYELMVQNTYNSSSIVASWLGIVFFAFQIYFDFSGYSDMA